MASKAKFVEHTSQLNLSPAAPHPNLAVVSELDIDVPFGQQLKRLRRERGLTMGDVASAVGVSKPTIWAWEKGRARPQPDRLEAIAAALELNVEVLQTMRECAMPVESIVEQCRIQIAKSLSLAPSAVKITIEL